MSYARLHASLTASSIMLLPDFVFKVWITLLSMANEDGVVRASTVGLAHLAHKSKEETERALEILSSPDPDSTRKAEDGRRILPVEGGWKLVNYGFYRELGMSEGAKAYWRSKKQAQRKKGVGVSECPRHSGTVSDACICTCSVDVGVGVPEVGLSEGADFGKFYAAYPRKGDKASALEAFRAVVAKHGPGVLSIILAALERQKLCMQWKEDGGKWIPGPSKYLANEGWTDTTGRTVEVAKKDYEF